MPKINYSKLIERYCSENNLNYEQFAEKVGVSMRQIFRWVGGENYPSYRTRDKLNEVLGIGLNAPREPDSETFVIKPISSQRRRSLVIGEEYYDMLREMALISNSKITHTCEQAIQFAYERFEEG